MASTSFHKNYPILINRVKNDVRTYSNISYILDKVEQDGNLLLIAKTFQQIIHDEFTFAVYGKLNRVEEAERPFTTHRHTKPAGDQYLCI